MKARVVRVLPSRALLRATWSLELVGPLLTVVAGTIAFALASPVALKIAMVGAAIMLLGRYPFVIVRERNVGASRKEVEISADADEISVDGTHALATSEIEQALVMPHGSERPTVRFYRKNAIAPAVELETATYEEGSEWLRATGFAPDQKAATFHSLVPKVMKWAPLVMMLPVLAPLFLLRHGKLGPEASQQMMFAMLALLGVGCTALRIQRRIVVQPDGLEVSTLGRFRRFIPFAEVKSAKRTVSAGSFQLKSGEVFEFRGGDRSPVLRDAQRANDDLVERSIEALEAWRVREGKVDEAALEAAPKSERATSLPSEVTLVRRPKWMWPSFFGTMGVAIGFLLLPGLLHATWPFWVGLALSVVSLPVLFAISKHGYRFTRVSVSESQEGLAFGDLSVRRDKIENAFVVPADAMTTLTTPKEFTRRPRVTFAGKKRRDTATIMVDDEAQGRAVLRALALDPASTVNTFKIQSGLVTNPILQLVSFVALAGGGQLVNLLHGTGKIVAIVVMVLAWINAIWPTKVRVGADGVLVQSPRSSAFYGFSAIEKIEVSAGGVVLILKSQRRVELRTAPAGRQGSGVDPLRDRLAQRLREGLKLATRSGAEKTLALARGDLDASAWLDRLRAIGKGEASSYRLPAIDPEDLWRVVEDPSSSEEDRIAAAAALRVDDDSGKRIRRAASLTASPKLRVALEAAADDDRATLERALTEAAADEEAAGLGGGAAARK